MAAAVRRLHTARRHLSKDLPRYRTVENQSPELSDINLYSNDASLREWVARNGASWAQDHLVIAGGIAGSQHWNEVAEQANANKPQFKSHDRFGNRVDVVHYHPAYHQLMNMGIKERVPSLAWVSQDKPGAQSARSCLSYLMYQLESGTQCPQTMTYAAVPALAPHCSRGTVDKEWLNKLLSNEYDPRDVPISEKLGITMGMSMTERQGGSDVRANTTVAEPCVDGKRGPGEAYYLNGHKWFTSAPMSDAFLTLAQTEEGISCFLVPRWIPHTGVRNRGFNIVRLKDKVGDWSNASSEVEYNNAWGVMLGEAGKGIQNILVMVQHTRLDCIVGSAGLIRRCVTHVVHHTSHRKAFGQTLLDTPIMRNVVADLIVESEAATALAFRLAQSYDTEDPEQVDFRRIATAIGKFHICKKAPLVATESMECMGGNGYIEEGPLARLFRQSPLNAIWEGSGNVICLDVMRAMQRHPSSVTALENEISAAHGLDQRFDDFWSKTRAESAAILKNPGQARIVIGRLAVALQASLLLRFGDKSVSNAYCSSRLDTSIRSEFGALPADCDLDGILARVKV
eukprot:m.17151 g.17151  ORF g.17151 m.17151 type:complete len:570 (+) comp5920_c0_seq1:150-1859(+)